LQILDIEHELFLEDRLIALFDGEDESRGSYNNVSSLVAHSEGNDEDFFNPDGHGAVSNAGLVSSAGICKLNVVIISIILKYALDIGLYLDTDRFLCGIAECMYSYGFVYFL
jgi:hypothetical protein